MCDVTLNGVSSKELAKFHLDQIYYYLCGEEQLVEVILTASLVYSKMT